MRISEHDEILVKYASNLERNELQKLAWDWVDIAQGLGIDALLGATVGGAGAALTGGSVGAGILGGIGLTSNPIGWVLLAAGVAGTIYAVTRQTDDNIEDLISRLNSLDPNPRAQSIVNNWIQTLQGYQSYFDVQSTAQDPKQRAVQLGQQIAGLTEVLNFLKQMQIDWPQVKSNLTDIGFDAGQAETALVKTTQAVEAGLTSIKQTAQQEGTKLVKQLGQQSGVDYTAIAQQVLNLHDQIEQLDGAAPEYEEYEKPAFQLAQNILANKAEIQDINEIGPQMKSLVKGLEAALRRAQRKSRRRTSSTKNFISKRAVRLSGESATAPAAGRGGAGQRAPAQTRVKDPAVQALQKSINYLNLNLKTGVGRIAEDGDYGQNTANALVALLEKVPVVEQHLMRRVGIDRQSVADVAFMRENSDYFAGLVSVMTMLVNQMYPASGTGARQQYRSEYDQQVQCREDKENPKPAEILACLRARQVKDPQTDEVSTAYEYLKQRGMRDNDIVALINQLFGGARSEDWSMPLLVKYVSGPRFTALRSY